MTDRIYDGALDLIGHTPLVRLARITGGKGAEVCGKLESNNVAGSVKDRPALSMILAAEESGELVPGSTVVEATSGNTGIGLAFVAAARGYGCILTMPNTMSLERRMLMKALGAQIILTDGAKGIPAAIQAAEDVIASDPDKYWGPHQFENPANPAIHEQTTGPEIWRDTNGEITHFVSAMGTTGTIMGTSRYLKEVSPGIEIVGVQPDADSSIPGIRRWPEEYLPTIFEKFRVDRELDVSQQQAEEMTRRLAAEEGIFAGVSSGGAVHVAINVAIENPDATVVVIICDRGDRYLSTGVFPAE